MPHEPRGFALFRRALGRGGAGRPGELWPVLLLLIVVVVPTLGVLWFVGVAMKNEQLASRQRLTDAYQGHLRYMREQLDAEWERLARHIQETSERMPPAQLFAEMAQAGVADAVVCYDEAGRVLYPTPPPTDAEAPPAGPLWQQASFLEHEERDFRAATELYARFGQETQDLKEKLRAARAQIRCLFKLNEVAAAVRLTLALSESRELASLEDASGRSILPSIWLIVIEHLAGQDRGEAFDLLAAKLRQRLLDYDDSTLSSSQRLFLMKRLAQATPEAASFPTLAAEDLAAQFVAAHPTPSRETALQRSQLPHIWQLATPDRRVLLLLSEQSVIARSARATVGTLQPEVASLKLLPPGETPSRTELLASGAGEHLPGWRLSLSLADSRQLDEAVAQQKMLYLWIGGLVVLSTTTLALFIARAFRRQIRLATLKNDLVGTVSHELKTPLASMRLLVDTLLDAERLDEQQAREYLRLIAKENLRLSRLVESFLTFSRLEQGRHAFDFTEVSAAQLIERAVEAAGERFHEPSCSLTREIEEGLPSIRGDADALVAVLLNLLDNAYKYSHGDRQIVLRAFVSAGQVCLAVQDNGIGMSRSAARKVFQQFYQADRSLARQGHGCGLGLSIVEYIVRAHGGATRVVSRLGQGSTFTISLPAA